MIVVSDRIANRPGLERDQPVTTATLQRFTYALLTRP
jgi:hypothetical protein